jgi:hypothetical protein
MVQLRPQLPPPPHCFKQQAADAATCGDAAISLGLVVVAVAVALAGGSVFMALILTSSAKAKPDRLSKKVMTSK